MNNPSRIGEKVPGKKLSAKTKTAVLGRGRRPRGDVPYSGLA